MDIDENSIGSVVLSGYHSTPAMSVNGIAPRLNGVISDGNELPPFVARKSAATGTPST
jgi:hypothetical protein